MIKLLLGPIVDSYDRVDVDKGITSALTGELADVADEFDFDL